MKVNHSDIPHTLVCSWRLAECCLGRAQPRHTISLAVKDGLLLAARLFGIFGILLPAAGRWSQ